MRGWFKLILDGSSLGNSGIIGSCGVIRDDVGNRVQGVFKREREREREDKLHIWFLIFMSYFNLVLNLLNVSIWSLTF